MNLRMNEDSVPPDGGRRACFVLVASFICNGATFGIINSYGVIYSELDTQLHKEGVNNHESKAAVPGGLAAGMTFLLSALSGVVSALLGLRNTAVIGGCIIVLSLTLSSFAVHSINALYFTHGFLFGLGGALTYTPAIAILGHYFKKHLGRANGIVTVGESFFTVVFPFLMEHMIDYGLQWMFRVLAILTLSIALGGLVYKPMPSMEFRIALDQDRNCKSIIKTSFNFGIWKNKRYRIWSISMAIALVGHFVPFVHLGKFIQVTFPNKEDYYANVPIQCLAASSMIGRVFFGYISDLPKSDPIQLQQIALYMLGGFTMIMPFVKSFALIVVISLAMGIFEGAIIVLTGPVATEICGVADAPHGIGFMFGLTSVPVSFSPPFAGYLYSVTNSYILPFVFASIWLLGGASLMFSIRFPCFGCCGRNQNPNTHGKTILTGEEKFVGTTRAEQKSSQGAPS